ncbi:MAG: glycine oxidase ThiO [Capsulimonas sp.]|uniref:glycine oxidase ThiO n=1 Tax=Capsulimonas sp. TaxID=2494211 RepID=UPI0032639A50
MSKAKHFDVAVIGGGVIGMSLTWRLSQRKASVAVIDSKLPGQATHAAAGMLAPLSDAASESTLLDLGLASLEKYSGFVQEIAELVKSPLQIEGAGILRIARDEDEAKRLKAMFRRRTHLGLPLEMLTPEDLREAEPQLTPDALLAILSPAEQHIQPRLLLEALEKAAKHAGAAIYSGESVTKIDGDASELYTVHTDARAVSCDHLVICGGAWSGSLAELLPKAVLPVTPLKGHLGALDASSGSPLRHTICAGDCYLVPRENGELVFGATEEPEAQFDPETHPYTISRLRLDAEALVPALSGLALLSGWSGLRPASPDGLPILGRMSRGKNIYAATGHGRNGILLAPQTADLLTSCILGGHNPPKAFDPSRFHNTK